MSLSIPPCLEQRNTFPKPTLGGLIFQEHFYQEVKFDVTTT